MTSPEQPPIRSDAARRIDEKAQALGREAEAAANRFATNPAVQEAADAAGRIWGLVLLVVGLWLVAAITFRLDLPSVAWSDFWPLILIVFGALIVVRGLARRR